MSDLIDRQMAIDALSAILDNPNHAEFLYGDEICKTLQDLPSAERTGRWEWEGFNIVCSECDYSPCFDSTEPLYHFCPNCGARMEEEA